TDMKWNPTSDIAGDVAGEPFIGGGHAIFVFGVNIDGSGMPAYDGGDWLHERLSDETLSSFLRAWKNCLWVVNPLLADNEDFMSSDVKMQIRVSHPYQNEVFTGLNEGLPAYRFTTSGIQT